MNAVLEVQERTEDVLGCGHGWREHNRLEVPGRGGRSGCITAAWNLAPS